MTPEIIAKLESGEEPTTEESIVILTHLIDRQDNQIQNLQKANDSLTESLKAIKEANDVTAKSAHKHEVAILEIQSAIVQLQRMHEADRNGVTQSGIVTEAGGFIL